MRLIRRVFAVGVMSALVAIGAPSAGAQTPTVTSVVGSANGLSVNLDINLLGTGVGVLSEGPTPTATLPPEGGSDTDTVISIAETVLTVALSSGTLVASTEGELGPAGFATAESTVEDLGLSIVGGASLVAAEAISASCEAGLDGVTGSTTLAGASVLGTALDVAPPPNTVLPLINVPGVGAALVTLNSQVENPDGSLSVTALAIELNINIVDVLTIQGTVAFGPATCGVVEGEIPPGPPPPDGPGQPGPAQPVPVTPRFTG